MAFETVVIKDNSGLIEDIPYFILSKWRTYIPNFFSPTNLEANHSLLILPSEFPKRLTV